MAEITNQFARFILECKETWEELCENIDNGDVPAGNSAKVTLEISASQIDEIREERLAVLAEANGHG